MSLKRLLFLAPFYLIEGVLIAGVCGLIAIKLNNKYFRSYEASDSLQSFALDKRAYLPLNEAPFVGHRIRAPRITRSPSSVSRTYYVSTEILCSEIPTGVRAQDCLSFTVRRGSGDRVGVEGLTPDGFNFGR